MRTPLNGSIMFFAPYDKAMLDARFLRGSWASWCQCSEGWRNHRNWGVISPIFYL